MTEKQKTLRAAASTLAGFFMLSSIGVLLKFELGSGASVEWIVFIQFLTSFAVILLIAWKKGFAGLRTDKLRYHLVRGVMGIAAFALFTVAVSKIPLVNASLLNNTAPIFIPFVTLIWLGTRISGMIWWGIAIGFTGIIFILDPSGDDFLKPGDLFGLGAGISLAIAYVALGILAKTESFIALIFYYSLIAVMVFLPLAVINWSNPEPVIWILAVFSGLLFVGYLFFLNYGYSLLPAVKLAPLNFSAVVFTGILDWIFYGHVPGLLSVVGIMLVVAGGMVAIVFHARENTKFSHSHWH